MSNKDMAQRVAAVADALAEYDHLPPIERVSVSLNHQVLLSPAYVGRSARIRNVAAWATAFEVPVVLDANASEVRAYIQMRGEPAEVWANLGNGRVFALRAALGLSLELEAAAAQTEVDPARLLAVLDAAPAVANA